MSSHLDIIGSVIIAGMIIYLVIIIHVVIIPGRISHIGIIHMHLCLCSSNLS